MQRYKKNDIIYYMSNAERDYNDPTSSNSDIFLWTQGLELFESSDRTVLEKCVLSRPDLAGLLKEIPLLSAKDVCARLSAWNAAEQKPREGVYRGYRFYASQIGFAFFLSIFQNGRITFSFSIPTDSRPLEADDNDSARGWYQTNM